MNAYAAGVVVSRYTGRAGWEPRIYATVYRVEAESTTTTGVALLAHGTYWFGVYGLGAGSGLGWADFEAKDEYGWDGSSAQVLFYVSPLMLRFGGSPQLELGTKLGSTRFFEEDIEPFGYGYVALHF